MPRLDLKNPFDRQRYDDVILLADQLQAGYAALRSSTLTVAREQAQGRLRHLERRLNALVYSIYSLTEAEIAHVASQAS